MIALLPDVTVVQLLLTAAAAFLASVVSGMAGYGTGLLLPLILVPLIGPQATVPVIAITALFTNFGRAHAMRQSIDWRAFRLMAPIALPFTVLGAWTFSSFDKNQAQISIGCVLLLLVPLRHLLKRAGFTLRVHALPAAGAVYGLLVGGTTGVGVILISFLMAAGLVGNAVIATDAAISIAIGILKVSSFSIFGALMPSHFVFAFLIGMATLPGGYVAKTINDRLALSVQMTLLDAAVLIGGAVMVVRALT